MPKRPPRLDNGSVTAEAAVAMPALAALAMVLVWLVSIGVAQIRVVDAARDAARAIARGEEPAAAVSQAHSTAPHGAQVTIRRSGGVVLVKVVANVAPLDGLVPMPAAHVESSAAVRTEADETAPPT